MPIFVMAPVQGVKLPSGKRRVKPVLQAGFESLPWLAILQTVVRAEAQATGCLKNSFAF